jgi:hypothetical protein
VVTGGDEEFGPDLTRHRARLVFCWSKMRVSDELFMRQVDTSLTFVDFLEALGRVADMKALPTDEEIASFGLAPDDVLGWFRAARAAGWSWAGGGLQRARLEDAAADVELARMAVRGGGGARGPDLFTGAGRFPITGVERHLAERVGKMILLVQALWKENRL